MEHQELRTRIQSLAARGAEASIELAFLVGPVKRDHLYRQWGFEKFDQYVRADLKCSRSHGYDLALIGNAFWNNDLRIKTAVKDGKVGIADLIQFSRLIEQGKEQRADVVAHIEEGAPLKNPINLEAAPEADTEQFIIIPVKVRKGDASAMKLGWIFEAIRGGHTSYQDAIVDHGIQGQVDRTLPPAYEKYREVIEAGEFFCKLCGKIPAEPTMHHVLLQSLYQGKGPTVLLCWDPCHERIVQPNHELYGRKWFGNTGYENLLVEYREFRVGQAA